MKPKEYKVLVDCLESGIKFGLHRVYKHTDSPTREQMEEQLLESILTELSEYFDFEEESIS